MIEEEWRKKRMKKTVENQQKKYKPQKKHIRVLCI